MNYLKPSFTIPPPETLNGVACEACVYGTKRGEKHTCRLCIECGREHPPEGWHYKPACPECGHAFDSALLAGHRLAEHGVKLDI